MPLFVAAALLGWEAMMGLVGISSQLPALRSVFLLGVMGSGRDGRSGIYPGEQPGGTSPSPTTALCPLYRQEWPFLLCTYH